MTHVLSLDRYRGAAVGWQPWLIVLLIGIVTLLLLGATYLATREALQDARPIYQDVPIHFVANLELRLLEPPLARPPLIPTPTPGPSPA